MNVGVTTSYALLAAVVTVAIPACDTIASRHEDLPLPTSALQLASLVATQQAELLAGGGDDFDTFGGAVAISGDTALVGASRDDDMGSDAGAVYVFARSGTSWIQQAKLTAADGGSNDNFGFSVALSGNTAVVGAIADDDVTSDAGAAYVFVRSGTTWSQQAKLTAADGTSNDQLGFSIAVSGDTAVVGAVNDDDRAEHAGSAYVFVRSGTTWTQQAKLIATDTAAFDQLGWSVAVSGDTAVVGARLHDDANTDSGSAYVFVRGGTSWTQQAKLTAGDAATGDTFGAAVAVSGTTAVVGAPLTDANAADSGSAYVFTRSGTSWTQQAKLTAADAGASDSLGAAAALDGDTVVVGAPNDGDLGAASGSAYVFTRSGTSWTQQTKLTASDGAAVDLFGTSVAVSGSTSLIGAPGHDDLGPSSGSAYVYAPPGAGNGAACTTSANCASGFCIDGVCCNTACGGGDPTDCQACGVVAGAAVDGTCAATAAGTVCRAAAGACDVAETCNGTSTSCPSDVLTAAGTVCRTSAGACDAAEHCTGSSAACPSDALAGAGTVCRAAVGSCDLAESCTGGSAACPSNQHKPDLSLCIGGLLGLPGLCLGGVCVL